MKRLRAIPSSLSRPFSLGFSLVVLSLSVLLFLDLFGMRDGGREDVGAARKVVARTLAMHLTTLLETGDTAGARYAASVIVADNADVRAVSLIGRDGVTIEQYGELDLLGGDGGGSTLDRMNVPVFADGLPWGTVRVAFSSNASRKRDALWLGAVALGLFASFTLFLRRVLVQLDPGRAVPGRVDSALSLFNSGVIVLDDRARMVVVNPAAVAMTDRPVDALIGRTLDEWPWAVAKGWQAPWTTVLHGGPPASDELLELTMSDGSTRFLSLSCAFVGDESQGLHGVLVTLDDLTSVEHRNRELDEALREVSASQQAISEKNRELELLASTDALTGLSNRRTLMERLALDMERCRADGSALSCIMTDIDHFKSVNDTYGHAVGDDVIQAVAGVLKAEAREGDTIGRYGGEEFVVVLPGLDAAGAARVAERLRVGIVALALGGRLAVPKLSSSFGVADLGCEAPDGARFVDCADQALYQAKQNGRNRVERFGDVAAASDATPGPAPDPTSDPVPGTVPGMVDGPMVETAPVIVSGEPSNEEVLHGRVFDLESRLADRQDELDTLRRFDTLTGMPMRSLFLHRVETELVRARRARQFVGVMSVAIRGLERVVAALGDERADALVLAVVDRLQKGLRATDVVSEIVGTHSLSRMTSNEYAVLINELDNVSGAMIVVARLQRLFSRPFVVDGERLYVGANIGIALSERTVTTATALLAQACEARAEAAAKPDKVSHAFASPALDEQSHDYLRLEVDLHDALESGALETWFQPKFDVERRSITGMEALVRWQHPVRGFVPPDEFVLVAEANGMIDPLFALVLERTLAQIGQWNAMGIDDLLVSVNVSPSQLRAGSLVEDVISALGRSGVAARQLEIELTETAVLDDPDEANAVLDALRAVGVRIALDDFGTGYTSLSLLARLPLDTVKIDRSFIVAMANGERDEAMVESIITMARALKLRVVAEGVETNEELEKLAHFGCHEVQGYLISRPMQADDMTAYLVSQRSMQRRRRA